MERNSRPPVSVQGRDAESKTRGGVAGLVLCMLHNICPLGEPSRDRDRDLPLLPALWQLPRATPGREGCWWYPKNVSAGAKLSHSISVMSSALCLSHSSPGAVKHHPGVPPEPPNAVAWPW